METETVEELTIYAGQGSIELDEHALDGFPGTISDVLKSRGHVVERTTFLLDHAGAICPILARAFPGLKRVHVYKAKSPADGGGHDLWDTFGQKE